MPPSRVDKILQEHFVSDPSSVSHWNPPPSPITPTAPIHQANSVAVSNDIDIEGDVEGVYDGDGDFDGDGDECDEEEASQ